MAEIINKDQIFDVVATPFQPGVTLVEASAGTGKTFAIGMLVLRAVVELGIDIDKILVVTYTVAATEELRGRIRSRLTQARNLLSGSGNDVDAVLTRWLESVSDTAEARRRLELALLEIDSMSIFTIHGFCQRILAEQVLESDQLFETDLLSDTLLQRNLLIRDFWRQRLYQIDKRYGCLLVDRYRTPEQLYESIYGAENPLWRLRPEDSSCQERCRELDEAAAALRLWWLTNHETLAGDLREAALNGLLKKEPAEKQQVWLDTIQLRFGEDAYPEPGQVAELLPEKLIEGLNGNRVRGPEKKQNLLNSWRLPGDEARRYLEAVAQFLLSVRIDLARYLRRELPRYLKKRAMQSFNSLIVDLEQAIRADVDKSLVRQVGSRYTIALIDEFQDTDAAQYTIFSELFGQGHHHLYLIGDPKQAIYRFRGADIHSYLMARQHVDRRLTLNCNYRSNPGLVSGLNQLLAGSEIGSTPYLPIRCPERSSIGRLIRSGVEQPPLIYCRLEAISADTPQWSGGAAAKQIGSWIVNEVIELIHPQSGWRIEPYDYPPDTGGRRVRPSDIGILVRTNRQAEEYFHEFSRRGVPVVLSSRKAVFQTPEADDLLLVLQAAAAPSDSHLLRTVLSIEWFGLDGNRFFHTCRDAEKFNRYRERFYDYHRCWSETGLMQMMNQLLENEQVFLHLSRYPQAERRITNIQHLIELLQQEQSEHRLSASQTLNWFQERISDPAAAQEAELRLESDSEAVNVVTMHSAKGLEYEIVFCPFLYRSSLSSRNAESIDCYDPLAGRICDLGSDLFDYHVQLSRQEEIEEDMRLAYVAMTRARLRAYLFWADIKPGPQSRSSFESPLGSLLFPAGSCSAADQRERIEHFGSAVHCLHQTIVPDQPLIDYTPIRSAAVSLQARKYASDRLQTNRLRTSFSGLTMLSRRDHEEPARADDERGFTAHSELDSLPGGVRFGNLVHEALERFAFADLAGSLVGQEAIAELISSYRYTIDPGAILDLLRRAVTTPLFPPETPGAPMSLAEIPENRLVKEMEFTLHLDPLSTTVFNDVLAAEPTVRRLAGRDIEGYLNGFIDLVCAYEGRYYVVDYKTNNLGPEDAYHHEGLVQAMRSHNYGLQYWIYSLVVHRYLKNRLSGYRYRKYFGGILYLFVRAMTPAKPGYGIFFDRPDEEKLMALDGYFGGGIDARKATA